VVNDGSVDAEEATQLLAKATGRNFELVGRLTGGETGAHEVRGPGNERLVLKWELDPSSRASRRVAVGLTERLQREAHWPVPQQEFFDVGDRLLITQELLPGRPVQELTHDLLDQLFALHQARLGLARPEDDSTWPDHLIETLALGGASYCLHEPLRKHDRRTAELIDRIERVATTLDPESVVGHDIVHWDWHQGNLLEVDGDLTAVIDNDFVTTGDAAFDLVTLAVAGLNMACEDGVRDRIDAVAFDGLSQQRRQAYEAHLLLRLIDWSIRTNDSTMSTSGCPRRNSASQREYFDRWRSSRSTILCQARAGVLNCGSSATGGGQWGPASRASSVRCSTRTP